MDALPPCALSGVLAYLTTKEIFRSLLRCSKALMAGVLQSLATFDAGTTNKADTAGVQLLTSLLRSTTAPAHAAYHCDTDF